MMEKAATLPQFPHLTLPRSSEGIRVSTGSSGIPLPLLWPPWLKPENAYPRQKRIVHPASWISSHWIIKKAREFQINIYFCFTDYAKAFDCVDHHKLWKILKEVGIPDHLTCLLRNLYAGQEATVRTGHKKYFKAVYGHPAYLTYMQNTSCKTLGWMKHKLESRLLGEI